MKYVLDESFVRAEKKHKPPQSHCDHNFAMAGIAAGQKLWGRLTGLVRSDRYDDLCSLMEWKNYRHNLAEVARPDYNFSNIEDVYPLYYDPEKIYEYNPTQPKPKVKSRTYVLARPKSKPKQAYRITSGYHTPSTPSSSGSQDEAVGISTDSIPESRRHLYEDDHHFHSDFTSPRDDVELHKSHQMGGLQSSLSVAMKARLTLAHPLF